MQITMSEFADDAKINAGNKKGVFVYAITTVRLLTEYYSLRLLKCVDTGSLVTID